MHAADTRGYVGALLYVADMSISESDLGKISDEKIRRLIADVLSHEYTRLSAVGHEIFRVADHLDEIDLEELRAAQPDTIREELRRCEVALARLSMTFTALADSLSDVADDESPLPPRSHKHPASSKQQHR